MPISDEYIPVEITKNVIKLLSENLYSSYHKIFEELICNSYDAEANEVFIHIPKKIDVPEASIWFYDNGK